MSSKIQKLSVLATLLAVACSAHAGPIVDINNYKTGNTFTYTSGYATALTDATVVLNMSQGGDYVGPTDGDTTYSPACAYVMWHFTTNNPNVTFGNDLTLSGQVLYNTTWAGNGQGWTGSDIYVLTSTVGSVDALNTGTANWAWVHEGAWTETFTQKSLGGAGAGYSDFYVAFKVTFPVTSNHQNWQVQFLKSDNPFVLSGSLVPEPASLALLGLAAAVVGYRRRQ